MIPDGFALAAYWRSHTADFLASLHQADAVLPIESVELAAGAFLSPDIEVLEPAGLRARIAATARAITAIYQAAGTASNSLRRLYDLPVTSRTARIRGLMGHRDR